MKQPEEILGGLNSQVFQIHSMKLGRTGGACALLTGYQIAVVCHVDERSLRCVGDHMLKGDFKVRPSEYTKEHIGVEFARRRKPSDCIGEV